MNVIEKFLAQHKKRIVGLDIIRSIAILCVVYLHGGELIPKKHVSTYYKFLFIKIDGVSIFFVLSGFLIGGILIKIIQETNYTHKDLINFWIRRWFRTIPNYLIVLLGVLLIRIILDKGLADFNLKYFLFLQNFWQPEPHFFPELWSLAVEEWFYFLFPLFCFGFHKILKNKSKSILFSALLFLIIPLIIRIIKFEYGIGINDFVSDSRRILPLRLDSLMYGILAAYLVFKYSFYWLKYRYFSLIFGMLSLILMNFYSIDCYPPLYFNLESIITFSFLPYLSSYKTTNIKYLDSFFIFVSIVSYSMYLLHFTPVIKLLIPNLNILMGRNNLSKEELYLSNYFLYLFFTILISYILYRFFENPMTKLRDKIELK